MRCRSWAETDVIISIMDTWRILVFRVVFILVAIVIFAHPASAHMDRIIQLKETQLDGLPEEYMPAVLSLKDNYLRIANRRLNFPDCLVDLLAGEGEADLKITSSWYHDLTEMPPYIELKFHPASNMYGYKYGLLLNMKTLEPIHFQEYTPIENGVQEGESAMTLACKKEIHPKDIEAKTKP
jgi:hypothetical protein